MPEVNKNISMQRIAEHLDVSAMTVSRALKTDKAPQQKKARELFHKIRKTAAELGYRKSFAPRSMVTGRYGFISVLGSDQWHRNHMPHVRLVGLQESADRHGISLLFNRIPDAKLESHSFIPEIFSNCQSDGFLINYISGYPERFEKLLNHYSVPAIWMNSKHKADCIHPDDFNGARMATEHLIKLGHKHIAFMGNFRTRATPGVQYHYSVMDRVSGYLYAMKEAGLNPLDMKSDQPLPYKDFKAFVESFLNLAERPTAILAYGVPHAVAVLKAAASFNLRIPEDLSIIIFDSEENIFQFTTAVVPEKELGLQAVDLIMKKIAKPDERLDPVVLPMKLHLPDITCAPAP